MLHFLIFMLNFFMLNVVKLNVIILIVIAPIQSPVYNNFKPYSFPPYCTFKLLYLKRDIL
jgi:hypothetical protein